ncbi:hypothetical protein GCM10010377_80560 [Streptomyces viridiviolaceus]|nr:hypothetical protein GCM10010377_80560 [Streptomyces viridiviolaceus]
MRGVDRTQSPVSGTREIIGIRPHVVAASGREGRARTGRHCPEKSRRPNMAFDLTSKDPL